MGAALDIMTTVFGAKGAEPLRLHDAIEEGLSIDVVDRLNDILGKTLNLVALIGVPKRTLTRRRSQGRLDPVESARVVRVTRILAHAADILGRDGTQWLASPNPALGGRVPADLMGSDLGAEAVHNVLFSIEYGMGV